MRQAENLFGKALLCKRISLWDAYFVGEKIVYRMKSRRIGVTDPRHLNRCRAVRHNRKCIVL